MLENKYRPEHWRDLILPTQGSTSYQVAMVKDAIDRREYPLRVFLSGPSGVGKSSAANVIANAVGDASVRLRIDGADVTRAMVNEWKTWFQAHSMFGPAVVIIEEAQNIGAASTSLMHCCDSMKNGVLIMTTMSVQKVVFVDQQTDVAITRRCKRVEFTTQGLAEPAAVKLLEIARKEGKDFGRGMKEVLRLVQTCKNNIRDALQAIDDGALCPAGAVKHEYAQAILAA